MILTFVETRVFTRQARDALPGESLRALQRVLLERPRAGAVVPGLHGVRKLRWYAAGKGKRGGVRVLYFADEPAHRIYLLLVYAKSGQDELTPDQRLALLRALGDLRAG